jgi:two-component system sensor histidine kinase EvgS
MRRVEMGLAGELAGTDEVESGRQPNAEAGRLRGDIT